MSAIKLHTQILFTLPRFFFGGAVPSRRTMPRTGWSEHDTQTHLGQYDIAAYGNGRQQKHDYAGKLIFDKFHLCGM